MPDSTRAILAAALALVFAAVYTQAALAQSKGRIICWKDQSGKVIGCGDKVPPEYQDSATKELDRRGVTRKTTETAEEEARRKAQEAAKVQQLEVEKKRLAEQRRRDMVLLNTYANDREIDQRRDREVREVDRLLGQFQGLHKGAVARRDDAQQRLAAAETTRKPSDAVKDEIARAEAEMARLEKNIDAKNKEREGIIARYAETKRRYLELGGVTAQAATAKK
jgi:hypothetical protein